MNCTGLKLKDCPLVNDSILTLILDDNLIKDFNTQNCQNWTHYGRLSIRRNQLESFLILKKPNMLETIDLSQNNLKSINLDSSQIRFVDISYNSISNKITLALPILNKLIISNNLIDNAGLDTLIYYLHKSPSLSLIDVSYNKFNKTPVNFMDLSVNRKILMNFTGNNLLEFSFVTKFQHGADYDLSFNQIANIKASEHNGVLKLNLSHNKLANIDTNELTKLINLELFDLSGNPLNCLCSESRSFIQWMITNKNKFTNRNKTMCEKPDKKSIFYVKCPNVSSSTTPSVITSTTFHPPHSPPSTHLPISPNPPHPPIRRTAVWKILVPIFIILLLGFGLFVFVKRRRRHEYQRIDESQNSTPLFGCECFPMLSFRPRQNSGLLINQEDSSQDAYRGARLNFEVTLNVICSSKDRRWTTNNVTCYLDIKKNIISSKIQNLPFCDYTLIVVNGDNCLKDNTFVTNVDKSLTPNNREDIKILINEMPDFENCRRPSLFIDFLREKVNNNRYFQYYPMESDTCLSNLKIWLKLDFVPHNV